MTEFLQRTQEFDMIKLPKNRLTKGVRIIRTFARTLGTIFSLLILYLIVEFIKEGASPGGGLSPREVLSFTALFLSWMGLVVGFKSEFAGGFLNVFGVLGFFLLARFSEGNLPFGIFLPALALPGLCYLFVWVKTRGDG